MESSGERQDWFSFDQHIGQDSIDLLVGEQHCPLCGCEYEDTQPVRERDGVLTLAVQCHCCGTGSLVTVTRDRLHEDVHASASLTPVEQAFFASLRPIGDDDLDRMRAIIRMHQGDLRDLL